MSRASSALCLPPARTTLEGVTDSSDAPPVDRRIDPRNPRAAPYCYFVATRTAIRPSREISFLVPLWRLRVRRSRASKGVEHHDPAVSSRPRGERAPGRCARFAGNPRPVSDLVAGSPRRARRSGRSRALADRVGQDVRARDQTLRQANLSSGSRPSQVAQIAEVGVTPRYELTGRPDRVVLSGNPREVRAWAGPWPADERWWELESARVRARLQVVLAGGDQALLLVREHDRWAVEGVYD